MLVRRRKTITTVMPTTSLRPSATEEGEGEGGGGADGWGWGVYGWVGLSV
jgi:hypothetical protein